MKTKQTSLCDLSPAELSEINGGTTNQSSINMSSSADSLLSIDMEWRQGDMSRSYKVSAGNNVDLNLEAFGHKM